MRWQKVTVDGQKVETSIPMPGTRWSPLHKRPHQNNQPITIRRFIALHEEKKKL
jgi:hypothetical protein